MDSQLKTRIDTDLKNNKIVLYMKGSAEMPQCGFSAQAVSILNQYKKPFKTFNILEDESLRQGMKEYSNWPTFPQLYVNGEFIGGCDIMTELHGSGELQEILGKV